MMKALACLWESINGPSTNTSGVLGVKMHVGDAWCQRLFPSLDLCIVQRPTPHFIGSNPSSS